MLPIEGEDLRDGSEFEFVKSARLKADSTFIAILPDRLIVTRRYSKLMDLPSETPVIAHWHGQHRTDAFSFDGCRIKR